MQETHIDPELSILCDSVPTTIVNQHFKFLSGSLFEMNKKMQASLEELRPAWNDLPLDRYVKDQGKYRFRRFSQFEVNTKTGEVVILPHAIYTQPQLTNRLLEREFPPLQSWVQENRFLQELARLNLSQFPIRNVVNWIVDIHLVRVLGRDGVAGHPTPEGIHNDGRSFISFHLFERRNVDGGICQVFDLKDNLVAESTLTNCLDSFYANDHCLKHYVTPVTPSCLLYTSDAADE